MSQPKRSKYSTGHDQKYGYFRLGIYYEARLLPPGGHGRMPTQIYPINLCDLHFASVLLTGERMEGKYTGAKGSISQVRRSRTQKDEEKLLATGEVDDRFRLSNGGAAAALKNKTTGDFECWLLGPLKFWDITVGSLLLKLSGLQWPVMWTHHGGGPKKEDIHWLEFPKGFGASRGRCTVWGSYYTPVHRYSDPGPAFGFGGVGKEISEELIKQRKHVFPIDATKRWTWKVEAHFGNLTFDEAREQRDTTKHAWQAKGV